MFNLSNLLTWNQIFYNIFFKPRAVQEKHESHMYNLKIPTFKKKIEGIKYFNFNDTFYFMQCIPDIIIPILPI